MEVFRTSNRGLTGRPVYPSGRLHRLRLAAPAAALVSGLASAGGCVVPQPLGHGLEQRVREPRTGAEYFLYVPEAYVRSNGVHPTSASRLWPLVITFHGMKPYDTWDRQIHEWQEQADAYGYVVCAPWLRTCDSFMEFPLRKEHDYVLRDKEAVMAILDHVLATTRSDPNAVLSTSWSSGGFMAHYIVNRYPHRFRALATRLSNFSPDILTEATVPLYRDTPIAVFIGDSDFASCITQSKEAVAWYLARGFSHVEAKLIENMGHRRIPQTAAAFLARQLGIEPLRPDVATRTLAAVRMTDLTPSDDLLARLAPPSGVAPPAVRSGAGMPERAAYGDAAGSARSAARHPAQPLPIYASPANSPDAADSGAAAGPVSAADGAPRGGAAADRSVRDTGGAEGSFRPFAAGPQRYPVERLLRRLGILALEAGNEVGGGVAGPRGTRAVDIQLMSPATGPSPLYVAFGVEPPGVDRARADYLWTLDGVPIGRSASGFKMVDVVGAHTLAVLVQTADGQQYRGSTRVEVTPPVHDGGRLSEGEAVP